MKKQRYVYVAFKLHQKFYKSIARDLKKFGFKYVKAYVPTIKILTKTIKGEDIYEEVPLLFIYGFLKLPTYMAFDRYYLEDLRKSIPGINSFLKTVQFMHNLKKKARIDNIDIFDDFSVANSVPRTEVKRLKKISKNNEIFNIDDIARICVGDYLVLRGYPYDGMEAEILEIKQSEQKIKVQITCGESLIVNEVDFQNIIYSVYQNYNEDRQDLIPTNKLFYYGEADRNE